MKANQIIQVEVAVHFTGEDKAPGIKKGGTLNVVRHAVELNVAANAIPDQLVADISELEIGDNVKISNIELPEGATPTITDRDFTIATIAGRSSTASTDDEAAEGEGKCSRGRRRSRRRRGLIRSLRAWLARFLTGQSQPTPRGETPVLILVGQGNPGAKYAGNRHNFGFMVIDRIAEDYGFGPWRSKFSGQAAEGFVEAGGTRIKLLLLKPETFYNETGRAASEAVRFYKLSNEAVTIFHDEIDLAPGRLRVKRGGGHSGNNGIRSMLSHLGPDIRRIRMGVGHPGDKSKVMPYVLSDFSKADETWFIPLMEACSRALPFLVAGDDERYQTEVMRLAPAPKHDPKQANT